MQSKKTSYGKKIFFIFCAFFCAALLFIAILPWALSTNSGKEMLLSFLNKRMPGTVKIETLSLQWSGSQNIEGISFEAANGKVSLLCEKITCESSLFTVLLPSHDIGIVLIQNPEIEIHQTVISTPIQEKPQVQAASLLAEIPPNSLLPLLKIPFIGDLEIQKGKISIFSENTSPIVFNPIEGRIIANKTLSEVSVHITGETLQNNIQGKILVDSSFKETNSSERAFESTVSLKNFPIDGADQIISLQFPEYRNLLTEAIGPSLDLECHVLSSKESCNASLEAKSSQLQAQIQTTLKENEISLISPASLQITLPPNLFQKAKERFPKLNSFNPKNPVYFLASLQSFQIPKTENGVLIDDASFQGNLEIRPFQASSIEMGCTGTFSSQKLSSDVVTDIQILLKDQKTSSISKAHVSCKNPLSESSREIAASFDLGKMPTSFLKAFYPSTTSLSDLVGDFIEGTASLQGNARLTNISLQISSPLLQTEKGVFVWQDQKLSLLKSWQIHYAMNPENLARIVDSKEVVLQKSAPLTAVISRFEVTDFSSLKDLKIDAFCTSPSLLFSKLFSFSGYGISDLSLHLVTDSLSQISADLKSSRFSLRYIGGIEESSRTLFWTKPIQIEYALTKQELDQLCKGTKHPSLLETTLLQISIDPASLSLNTPSLDQVKLTAHLFGKEIRLENAAQNEQITLQNLETTLHFLGAKDILDFSLNSDVATALLSGGKISSQGTIKQLSSPNFLIKANVDLQNFPLELVDTFVEPATPLAPILGSPFDLKLSIDQKNDTKALTLDGKTPFLKISGALTLNSKGLFLTDSKSPLKVDFLLTPKAYEQIVQKKQSPFALSKDALFKASLSKLSIPFLNSDAGLTRPDLFHLALNAQIENDLISFYHKESKKPIKLENTKLILSKKDEKTPLFFSLDTATDDSQKGALHLDVQCKKLLDEKGEFKLSHVHSDVIASFQKFPSDVLEILFPSKKGQFSNLLGRSFDMTLKASLENESGPVALSMHSQNVKLSVEGQIRSGVFTLKQNAKAQVALTPETSKVFLQEVNPLSISSFSAEAPASVEIDAKGFSIPLSSFDLSRIEMPNVRITLGKVLCQNEGNLNLMLGLLKAKQTAQSKHLELWFTPIDLHIRQGVVNLERTEVLIASTYDIALWGRVDLPGNRVSMILGLTSSCLKQAFNIQDLPSDYVMHIPLTGTLDHVDLNKSVATSKIIALTLWQTKNAPSSAVGGLGGALVGGILNKVLAPPGNEGSTPPAKTPYPWQSSDSSGRRK